MTDEERDILMVRLDERVAALHQDVCGNGQPGLKQKVERLALAVIGIIVVLSLTVGKTVGIWDKLIP